MKKLFLVLGLLLTASLLAACGGGSSDTSDSTSASGGGEELSKSEWIDQADDVCQEYIEDSEGISAEIEALDISPKSPQEDLTEASELLRQLDASSKEETDELRGLEPPSADADKIDSMLTKVESTRDLGLQAADALEEGDEAKVEEVLSEGGEINDEAEEIAQDYGMKVCGGG